MSVSDEDVLRAKEKEWSDALRTGCSPSRTELAITSIKDFMQEILTDDFTNIDHFGTRRSKQDDINNCVGGSYVVNSITDPFIAPVLFHGDCAIVVGMDVVDASYNGKPDRGVFIWTDTWVRCGDTWQCAAHHGSKIVPL
jgi:hypothetical protein